jgi:hypothetical protein
MMKLTVCLLGDSQDREYTVNWMGTADFADGNPPRRVALIQNQDVETLISEHPEYGWCSVNADFCRGFEPEAGYPAMDQARLERAY